MITKENYYQEIKSIGVEKLPTPMQEMHAMIDELTQKGKDWADYKTDAEIKESVDVQFKKLYEWIKKNEVIETPKKSSPKKHADRRKGHKPVRKAATKKINDPKFKVGDIIHSTKFTDSRDSAVITGEPQRLRGEWYYEVDGDSDVYADNIPESTMTKVVSKKSAKQKPAKKIKTKATTLVRASKSKIDSWNVFKAENKKANKEMYFAYVEMMHAKGVEIPASISKQMEAFQKQSDEPVTMDLKFIKRFVKLNGKTVSKQDLQRYIKSLQKAIRDRQINKHSKYKSQIEHIQHILVNLHNQTKEDAFILKINEDTIKKYEKILNSFSPMIAVKLLKRFVLLQGKNDVDKIERLIEDITNELKNLDSKHFYYKALMEAKLMLNKARHTGVVKISEQELNGLLGFDCFCSKKKSTTLGGFDKLNNDMEQLKKIIPYIQPKYGVVMLKNNPTGSNKPNESHVVSHPFRKRESEHVINSQELQQKSFKKAGFTGKWLSLIGDPVEPFSMMIWSKPGKGKSTMAIEFSHYLASQKAKKILYISMDEGNDSYTMQDKFKRLNAFHQNIFISNGIIPNNLTNYDYVVFDLMNDFNFTYSEFKNMMEKAPNVSFISIFKSTVDGNYRGAKDWENLYDVSIYINDEGYAKANKNRFGAYNSINFLGVAHNQKVYKFTNLIDAEKFKTKQAEADILQVLVNGDDQKIWAVTPEHAEELKKAGYSIIN